MQSAAYWNHHNTTQVDDMALQCSGSSLSRTHREMMGDGSQNCYYDDRGVDYGVRIKRQRGYSFEELQSEHFFDNLDEEELRFYRMYGQPVSIPCSSHDPESYSDWTTYDRTAAVAQDNGSSSQYYPPTYSYPTSTVSYTLSNYDLPTTNASQATQREHCHVNDSVPHSQTSYAPPPTSQMHHYEWAKHRNSGHDPTGSPDNCQPVQATEPAFSPSHIASRASPFHMKIKNEELEVPAHMIVPSQQPLASYMVQQRSQSYPYEEQPPMDHLPYLPHLTPKSEDDASWSQSQPPLTVPSQYPETVPARSISLNEDSDGHSCGQRRHAGSPLRRSTSPRFAMRLSPLPSNKRLIEKKPALACLFCRGRKIACGPPLPGSKDKTCNQCARRHLKCEYPLESRRGMRKRKGSTDTSPCNAPASVNLDGPKSTIKASRKR